jgi:hypothetical protein
MNFVNGASVIRIWGTLPEGECLAHTQYMEHAEMLCKELVKGESKGHGIILVAISHQSLSSRVFHVDEEKE